MVRVGLLEGLALERPVLRRLRAELQRVEAMRIAGRALARSDLSTRRLAGRLERAGVAAAVRGDVVGTLEGAGVLDDARTAQTRAQRLAERGYGDAAIAARLEGEGIDETVAQAAIAELEPERKRARGIPPKRLAARGFSPETIEDVLGTLD